MTARPAAPAGWGFKNDMSVNEVSLSNGGTQKGKEPGVSAVTWALDGLEAKAATIARITEK
jgi:hypothetical protein